MIKSSKSVKILGLIISDDFLWNEQINKTIISCSKLRYLLTRLKRCGASTTVWNTFHQQCIRSVITYGFLAMCNMNSSCFNRLLIEDRKCTKIIGQSQNSTLEENIEKSCKKFAKRIKDNFTDHRLSNLFQVNPNGKYYPKFANTTRYRDSFMKYARSTLTSLVYCTTTINNIDFISCIYYFINCIWFLSCIMYICIM